MRYKNKSVLMNKIFSLCLTLTLKRYQINELHAFY